MKTQVSLYDWWQQVGTDNVEKVARVMKTSIGYLRALNYRLKRPSYPFAERLCATAQKVTPGFTPSIDELMRPLPAKRKATGRSRGGPRIAPSAEFLASRPLKARKAVRP